MAAQLCHPEGAQRPKDLSMRGGILRFAQDDNRLLDALLSPSLAFSLRACNLLGHRTIQHRR
jgi:hypothetical protein